MAERDDVVRMDPRKGRNTGRKDSSIGISTGERKMMCSRRGSRSSDKTNGSFHGGSKQ